MFYILTFMFIYKSNMFFLRSNNLWFERVAIYMIVVFNLRVKPICASITIIKFVLALIRSFYRGFMVLIKAQCCVVPFPHTNILTSFLSLSNPSTGLNNSTLPPPQGVYIQILILYNFFYSY